MEKYSEIEYRKVLAVLTALKTKIESSEYYGLHIHTFEDEDQNGKCFSIDELGSNKAFYHPSSFCLVYCYLLLGNVSSPVISFTMGQAASKVEPDTQPEKEKLFEIIGNTDRIQNEEWEKPLAFFIEKVCAVYDLNIRYAED